MATTSLWVPVVEDGDQNLHARRSLPVTLTASNWVNAAEALLGSRSHDASRLIGVGIQIDPTLPTSYFNLGLSLHHSGKIAAAIRAYRQALQLSGHEERPSPTWTSANRNLAQDLLLIGQFEEGWQRYEDRLRTSQNSLFHSRCDAPWSGVCDQRPLTRLVLFAEQGLGDTFMFCRFATQLQNRLDVPVSLVCQNALVNLLDRGTGIDAVVSNSNDPTLKEPGSLWCPLLSLPHRLKLDPSTLSSDGPYIQVDPSMVELWRQRLQRQPGRRLIGLHWQGNPNHEGSLYTRGRSMPFKHFEPLKQLNDVEFVSLQKGFGSEQRTDTCQLPFVRGQDGVSHSMDFIDTAAIISNCDLVISADSGVVHLAGALGIPTWVALRHIPEWRWGLHGDRTPWYPSVRLYRQPTHGRWDVVIQAMQTSWQQQYPA
ncbi:glycosyltransferase family 9 protein [Synechococcus sp. LTW-G]